MRRTYSNLVERYGSLYEARPVSGSTWDRIYGQIERALKSLGGGKRTAYNYYDLIGVDDRGNIVTYCPTEPYVDKVLEVADRLNYDTRVKKIIGKGEMPFTKVTLVLPQEVIANA